MFFVITRRIVEVLVIMARDYYREVVEHELRVKSLVYKVCQDLGWELLVPELLLAAENHDIGKRYVQEKILYAERSLTQLEKDIVDLHSLYGYWKCREIGFSREVCLLVLVHHGKKWFVNNFDVPEDVWRASKILVGCDIWDALTTNRVYRRALPRDVALEILKKNKEVPFDVYKSILKISEMC